MATSTSPRASRSGSPADDLPQVYGRLPGWAGYVLLAGSAAAVGVLLAVSGFSLVGFVVLTLLVYIVALYTVSRRVEGRRRAVDRLVTILVSSAFALAMLPLVSLVWTVLDNGLPRLDLTLFTQDMRGVIGPGGGILHALVGTLLITVMAALISVPIGLLTAVYLVEYGGGRLAKAITFLVDVMTGIPSIVAGLFAYALFVLFFGPGVRLGAAGGVALSVLMIPVVVRACEEMLRLVPNELREAAYALGVPKWRTVVKIVIPTAVAGIATGITLALARVIGETAPLLIVAGFTSTTNWDLFDGRMMTLPVFAYSSYTQPGFPPEPGQQRAWAAALVLIILVMGLNLMARLISRLFAPKTRSR